MFNVVFWGESLGTFREQKIEFFAYNNCSYIDTQPGQRTSFEISLLHF